MFVRLLKLPEAVRRKYDVSSLKHVVHAGAPCPPEVKRAMIEWWGPIIHEYYGATESSAVVHSTSTDWLAHPGTVGRPHDNCQVRIYDAEGRQLPAGEIGEVYMRNFNVPDFTYNNMDAKRAEIARGELLTAGDVGYLNEQGFLFLCDRAKDMVISGGVNIYPAEIESVLHTMPEVLDCAVFGIPDEEYGEAVAAVIEPRPGATLTAQQVRDYLRQRMAGYKVPKLVEFGRDLPREDSGKIFKRKLRDPYWEKAGRRI
jgi:long-chain acyl-CoA synthetase